jgi:hypothetical protein
MATSRAISEGWRLTDGILGAFPLPEPAPVLAALIERGHVRGVEKGFGCRDAEWIALRSWTYLNSFEAPEEDERCSLWFHRLAGRGEVFVNGERAAAFSEGELLIDVTGLIHPGDNALEVRFAPSLRALPIEPDGLLSPLPEIGIDGAVRLITTNFVALHSMSVDAHSTPNGIAATALIRITAYTAGKYIFQYALSDDEGAVDSAEVIERLPAAERRLTHDLTFAASPGPREGCELKLTILRSGVGCESVRLPLALAGDFTPSRLIHSSLPANSPAEVALRDRLRELGADGTLPNGCAERRISQPLSLSVLT